MRSRAWLLTAALALPAIAQVGSAPPAADAATSRIFARASQMGVPIEGEFRRIQAELDFDPASPATGSARVQLDVASFDLGDEELNRELRRPEWFDAAQHPVATFVSSGITALAPGRLEVAGLLTIKGRTLAVVVPVQHSSDGQRQVLEGSLPIRRLQFDVGSGAWTDTAVVADEVEIRFRLVTAQS
ncbi:MAG: YceI family protein [Gammaproteobacteria bacterium]|nr:YceI family protein [Gammaproteobacteria bacterium]